MPGTGRAWALIDGLKPLYIAPSNGGSYGAALSVLLFGLTGPPLPKSLNWSLKSTSSFGGT